MARAAALLDVDRWMATSDPDGVNLHSGPIAITAGPHRVSAAFIRRLEGPDQDLISPLEWSLASTSIADAYGFTTLPHLRDMAITGPLTTTGVSQTPSRRKIFTCHPDTEPQQMVCARGIVSRLASQAFRRPVTERDLNRVDAALQERRGGRRLRSRRPDRARSDSGESTLRVSLRGAACRHRSRSGLCDQRSGPGVAAVVFPVGERAGRGAAAPG